MSSSRQAPPSDGLSDFWVVVALIGAVSAALYLGVLWLCFRGIAAWHGIEAASLWDSFWGTGSWIRHAQLVTDPSWRALWYRPVWVGVFMAAALTAVAGVGCSVALLSTHRVSKRRDLRRADSQRDLVGRGIKTAGVFAGRFGASDFRVRYEDRGLVIGPSRTGKTAFLLNQLIKLSESRLSFICADIKPEIANIVSKDLKAAGYRVVCINPASDHTDHYNLLDDLGDEISITELAINLLPVSSAHDRPFVEAKRDYLKAALLHQKALGKTSLPDVYAFLTQFTDIADFLDVVVSSSSDTASAIGRRLKAGVKADPLVSLGFASVARDIEWLSFSTVRNCLRYSDFSLFDLGKAERPVALFLQFEETRLEVMGPFLSMLYGHIFNVLIDNHQSRGAVGLFFDEIGNIPPVAGLLSKLNTVGGRKLPTWTYWQATSQMTQRYGPDADRTFFASADLQMFFRTQDEGTQRTISALAGTTHEIKKTFSTDPQNRLRSISSRDQMVNLIEPYELGELLSGEVVCFYRGGKAIGRATPYYADYPRYRVS